MTPDSTTPAESPLTGVPGIGPVRIAALKAAGIVTREDLAQSTVEQLISVAGMQPAYAAKALEAVRSGTVAPPPPVRRQYRKTVKSPVAEAASSAAETPPRVRRQYRKAVKPVATDTTLTVAATVDPVDLVDPITQEEPTSPSVPEAEPAPLSALDQAQLSLTTALADATRRFVSLERPLKRVAKLIDKLPPCAEYLSARKQMRVAAQMEDLTARLKKAQLGKGDLTPKQQEKLRERIRDDRHALEKVIADVDSRRGTA
jgi:hypothetical protein